MSKPSFKYPPGISKNTIIWMDCTVGDLTDWLAAIGTGTGALTAIGRFGETSGVVLPSDLQADLEQLHMAAHRLAEVGGHAVASAMKDAAQRTTASPNLN
jgi:hypothetical protein